MANEVSAKIKGREFVDQLEQYQLLTNNSVV
jgi:hypothetical protein